MLRTTLSMETLTCPTCVAKIENGLKSQDGVEDVKVLFNSSKAKIDHNESITAEQLADVVEKLGYTVEKVKTA